MMCVCCLCWNVWEAICYRCMKNVEEKNGKKIFSFFITLLIYLLSLKKRQEEWKNLLFITETSVIIIGATLCLGSIEVLLNVETNLQKIKFFYARSQNGPFCLDF